MGLIQLNDRSPDMLYKEQICILENIADQLAVSIKNDHILNSIEASLENRYHASRRVYRMCSSCKSVNTRDNRWKPVEAFISKISDIQLSHTICPHCQSAKYDNIFTEHPEKH